MANAWVELVQLYLPQNDMMYDVSGFCVMKGAVTQARGMRTLACLG